jgi:phosphatidylethanolamine/phosphatidyl-N-methylethanolamine N-methyltransferase
LRCARLIGMMSRGRHEVLLLAETKGTTLHPEIRRYYDEAYDDVNYSGLSGWSTRVTHREVERGLLPTSNYSRVLELGAAHGEHVRFVRHSFDEYVLSDIEDHDLDLTELLHQVPKGMGERKISTRIADAINLPFEDQSFDRTVHTCLLHHLADPEKALLEMRRVLRRDGLASIYLPCDPGLTYVMTQRLTTGRKQDRILLAGNYSISRDYLRAKKHPNQYMGLRALVKEVFRRDLIKQNCFPFPPDIYNLNYFSVFQIQVSK